MTNSDEPGDRSMQSVAPAQTRRLRWWIAGITFVAGFVFGVIAVGLLSVFTPDFGTEGGRRAGGTASPTLAPLLAAPCPWSPRPGSTRHAWR